MSSTNPNPTGEMHRIDASEASATGPGGTPMDNFASFSLGIEDPYTRERTVDNNTVDFDALLDGSADFAVFPQSSAALGMWQTILARTVGGVNFTLPQDDARSTFAGIGARYENVDQEDLGPDGYQITGSVDIAYITQV